MIERKICIVWRQCRSPFKQRYGACSIAYGMADISQKMNGVAMIWLSRDQLVQHAFRSAHVTALRIGKRCCKSVQLRPAA